MLDKYRKWERTYSIDAFEEGVSKDIKGHGTSGLDTTIDVTVTGIGESEVFLLDSKLLSTNGESNDWEFVDSGLGWVDPTLLVAVVLGAWDGSVDGLAGIISDQSKSGSGVSNGSVAALVNGLAVDSCRGGVEHPETLGVVHWGVVDILTRGLDSGIVDVTKGVERCSLVWFISVAPAAKICSEEFRGLWNVGLSNHVLNRGLDWLWLNCVDAAPSKTEETITRTLGELCGHLLCKLNRLVLNSEATNSDIVGAYSTTGIGGVTVGDLPGGTGYILEGGGLLWIKNVMVLSSGFDTGWKLSGPKLA